MKKLLTFLAIISCMTTFAHTLTKQCWSNNKYNIQATFGDANGKIEVTTYTNSTRTVLVEATQTYFLNSSGAVSFSVLQPQQNTQVFVYVRWFYKQGSNYFPTSWNSGQGYPNSYSSTNTGSNACSVVAVNEYDITSKQTSNELKISILTKNYNKAYLEYSKDNITFKRFEVTNSKDILFILEEGTTYIRVKYIVNNQTVYSNTLIAKYSDYEINYLKPYKLFVYNQEGKLINILADKQQLSFIVNKGLYYLKYYQIKNNIEIIKVIKFIRI